MKLYSIKDMKGDFKPVCCFSNDDVVIRYIPYFLENDEIMKRYPGDFAIYRVGDFDFSSGTIVPEATPVYICSMNERKDDDNLA